MDPSSHQILVEIGKQLDANVFPKVFGNGVIKPSASVASSSLLGEEIENEQQRPRGSATGSWKRTARWKGTPCGSRQTSSAPRIAGGQLRDAYETQLGLLQETYSALHIFSDDEGMWLRTESSVLTGLKYGVTFLIALPFVTGAGARAWAFWNDPSGPRWIGPRHTNFMDGSICAFSKSDKVWSEGGNLTTLMDLYTVWSLRHLHLNVIGRWPGRQYSLPPPNDDLNSFYRLVQCQDNELCACGSLNALYANCCKLQDLKSDFNQSAQNFVRRLGGRPGDRQPPKAVVDFLTGAISAPPKIRDVHNLTTKSISEIKKH